MGRVHEVLKVAGRECWTLFDTEARSTYVVNAVVDEIGKDEDGQRIEILFGALALRQWGIRPVPEEGRLDLSHCPEEFVEF